jgi:glycosyltransferase involved in cell wall biosynthesis
MVAGTRERDFEVATVENLAHSPRVHVPIAVGIFYPADPFGYIPSGINAVIRGILKWAPADLDYTLFGATSDPLERPVGRELRAPLGERLCRFVPLVAADASGSRAWIPLTVRHALALSRRMRSAALRELAILDFHRVEPLALFSKDARPKNVMLHQDMHVIRSADSDIGWRHAAWLYECIEPRLLARADRVFCVRRTAVERYREGDPGAAEKYRFISTSVDTSVFRPLTSPDERRAHRQRVASRFGSPAELLVWVGRLDRQKDPVLLLEAMRCLADARPSVHLLVVGDGTLRSDVERRIRELGLRERVTLLGSCAPGEIAELLQAADLFVLSSAYEGMPIAVLEALAVGVPVVATDVGEIRSVVRDGVNGFLAPRSRRDLARCASEALDRRAALRGEPCERSVKPYAAQRVLGEIYDNHRSQASHSVQ